MTDFQDPSRSAIARSVGRAIATGSNGIDHDRGVERFEAVPTPQIKFDHSRPGQCARLLLSFALIPDRFKEATRLAARTQQSVWSVAARSAGGCARRF